MNSHIGEKLAAIYSVILITFVAPCLFAETAFPPPPETKIETVVDTLHGVIIEDHYRWLEDQESPETREWIAAQNQYTRSIVDSLPFRRELSNRFEELLKTDYVSTPSERNGRFLISLNAIEPRGQMLTQRPQPAQQNSVTFSKAANPSRAMALCRSSIRFSFSFVLSIMVIP